MNENIHAIRTSRPDHVRYKANLRVGRQIPVESGYQNDAPHVSLTFAIPNGKFTNSLDPQSERFLIVVEPEAFVDLAQAMMKADSEVAIRAFGKAMQEFEIPVLARASTEIPMPSEK